MSDMGALQYVTVIAVWKRPGPEEGPVSAEFEVESPLIPMVFPFMRGRLFMGLRKRGST
jgi:hypothetical protein